MSEGSVVAVGVIGNPGPRVRDSARGVQRGPKGEAFRRAFSFDHAAQESRAYGARNDRDDMKGGAEVLIGKRTTVDVCEDNRRRPSRHSLKTRENSVYGHSS